MVNGYSLIGARNQELGFRGLAPAGMNECHIAELPSLARYMVCVNENESG
jgi:hypothetical protein